MTRRGHRAFGAVTGWWVTAARALALVLALAVAAPAAGLADDLAFHAGHRAQDRTEVAAAPDPGAAEPQAADPGLACHAHCGCHVAATLDGPAPAPSPEVSRRAYARASEVLPSVSPDRLPRPPRA